MKTFLLSLAAVLCLTAAAPACNGVQQLAAGCQSQALVSQPLVSQAYTQQIVTQPLVTQQIVSQPLVTQAVVTQPVYSQALVQPLAVGSYGTSSLLSLNLGAHRRHRLVQPVRQPRQVVRQRQVTRTR